jgi:hypothetical protein
MPKLSKITVLELAGREFQPVTVYIETANPATGTFSYRDTQDQLHSAQPKLLYLNEALSTDFRAAWKIIRPLIDIAGITFFPETGATSGPHRLTESEFDWSFVRDSSDNAQALMVAKIADSPIHARMKALGLWSATWTDNESSVSDLERPRPHAAALPAGSSNIAYGKKYDAKLTGPEISKAVRKDIKEAIKAGKLPSIKTSVRYDHFSGGKSIDVTVMGWPASIRMQNPERVRFDHLHPGKDNRDLPHYTEIGQEILRKLEEIRSAYNFDGSDIMTDYFHVNYYGSVHIDWQAERDERQAILKDLPRFVTGNDVKIKTGPFAGWYKIAAVFEDQNGLNIELAKAGLEDHVIVNGPDIDNLHLME